MGYMSALLEGIGLYGNNASSIPCSPTSGCSLLCGGTFLFRPDVPGRPFFSGGSFGARRLRCHGDAVCSRLEGPAVDKESSERVEAGGSRHEQVAIAAFPAAGGVAVDNATLTLLSLSLSLHRYNLVLGRGIPRPVAPKVGNSLPPAPPDIRFVRLGQTVHLLVFC